ncbi:torsin-1A-like isoform X1 [Conger conger]|uniref:torsin-1A-like isoform X1 n=1 Tax=Conger conger TaxID=82655 RepID=UPI002A5B09C8|nr:torsin-1A-like isoform X1 [Conger conger]
MAGRERVLSLAICFVLVGLSGAYFGENVIKQIKRFINCSPNYNPDGLASDLKSSLFGQHLASKVILKAVTGFMEDPNPTKPLVLSLHGSSGTGKNHVAKIIAQNLFKDGAQSSQVHLLIATHHFPHPDHLETYKAQLQQWIRGNVSVCPHSMFIFDEMDKMNPLLFETIKCFMEHYAQVDRVSYRHAMFLFLSNKGGEIITQKAMDFWMAGRKREEIELNSQGLETAINKHLFNSKNGGFWRSSLIDSNVVDFFIPFLPLEHKHVVMCALAEMATLGHKPDTAIAEKVADDFLYFPPENMIFSIKGCKSVRQRIKYYI